MKADKWAMIFSATALLFILMVFINTCEGSSLGDLGRAYQRQAFEQLPGVPYVPPSFHQQGQTTTITIAPDPPGAPRVITTHEFQELNTAPIINPLTGPGVPERLLYPERRTYFDENGVLKMRKRTSGTWPR
jgi:hypothetical protein